MRWDRNSGNISKSVLPTSNGQTFQPTYNLSTNRYSTLPGTTPARDNNGNLTSDGFHTYTWDAEGRLQHIEFLNSTWIFDALGRPVEKTNTQRVQT